MTLELGSLLERVQYNYLVERILLSLDVHENETPNNRILIILIISI